MAPPMIEIGAWTPDQPSISNAGLRVALNALPAMKGYDSMPGLVTAGVGSLNSACLGAFTGRARAGINFTVAGTATRLYLATTGSLANVSNGGGSPYTLATGATGDWWSFVLFGDRIIAANYADAPQSYVVGSSSAFAALSSDAPRAKHWAVVRDFVVAGNIIGRGVNATPIGTAQDAIQWCALDDPTSWPEVGTLAANSVQSDWQPFKGNGGEVTSVIGGSDYGLVFQERAIHRMDYEGGDTFFRFTPIDENRGCWIHKAAIRVGGVTYFPAEDGFMATDGMQTVPIGNELVDRYFLDAFNTDTQPLLSVAYFPDWKCIGWLFVGPGTPTDLPNTMLLFNPQSNRWAAADISAEWILTVLPFTSSLDDDSSSLDSGTYASVSLDTVVGATRRTAGAFDVTHSLSTFTSNALTAQFQTNEFEPDPGNVGTVLSLRPTYDEVDETSSFSGGVTSRMRVSDAQATSMASSMDATGKLSVRATGRYLSAYFNASGNFRNFNGFDVNVVTRGAR